MMVSSNEFMLAYIERCVCTRLLWSVVELVMNRVGKTSWLKDGIAQRSLPFHQQPSRCDGGEECGAGRAEQEGLIGLIHPTEGGGGGGGRFV